MIKNQAKDPNNIFLKKTYEWSTDIWKSAQHH